MYSRFSDLSKNGDLLMLYFVKKEVVASVYCTIF